MAIPDQLQQIDQGLITLLSERISILAALGVPLMQEQISHYKSLLMQVGVSECVWSSIVISSMAALASTPPLSYEGVPRNITVVGGRGIMGRFFTDRLVAAGHHVSILEYDGWDQADRLLGDADLVLICVPFKGTLAVIQKVAPYLSPTAILADIASTKVSTVQAMLDSHPGPVVGLHPMFGPGVNSFLSQNVVVCPGRKPNACQWFLNLIEAEGGKLITCTAEEHDRMMVAVQAIRHFATFSLGVFLAEEGISIDRSLDFASPIYRTEINLINRLFAQDASLYIDIMLASPDRCEAITRLTKTSDRLANLLAQENRTALMAEFEVARETFRDDSNRALKESNYIINTLSNFLAANEVETVDLSSALAFS
ncbi:bifunctional chorismate mutase/prephenate dehydrogenase [Myxacorys almedinensis]|uniref:Bifunctional chorismate mutase/prephenate dehydrogenase n=1 Tax=Myxacorys almedinensis A TaxID=2690445 RepID=A0A8J7Z219_9CYAN|nr:bifunctional chorismate mutase/prephenate dehydrogenase [Myxacorys almedinensis]NDJ18219.1 bifunctional chorismate mutase/prephenate dehydrogenase [Myxacorys almedinensis A]